MRRIYITLWYLQKMEMKVPWSVSMNYSILGNMKMKTVYRSFTLIYFHVGGICLDAILTVNIHTCCLLVCLFIQSNIQLRSCKHM